MTDVTIYEPATLWFLIPLAVVIVGTFILIWIWIIKVKLKKNSWIYKLLVAITYGARK